MHQGIPLIQNGESRVRVCPDGTDSVRAGEHMGETEVGGDHIGLEQPSQAR